MDALRIAYAKTALYRMGIPFEQAMEREWVRIAVESSARRSKPPSQAPAAKAAGKR